MRRVLRITRERGILDCNRPTGVQGPDTHDRTITTKTSDEMWAIDATGCLTYEGNAAVFVVVDHCTGECLGVRATRHGTRFEDIGCLREAIHLTKGRYEDKIAEGKRLRHDHGSQFISHAFPTSSRPSASSRARPSSASPIAKDASSDSSGP
jgi:transposase InsO family protein